MVSRLQLTCLTYTSSFLKSDMDSRAVDLNIKYTCEIKQKLEADIAWYHLYCFCSIGKYSFKVTGDFYLDIQFPDR